MKTIIKLGLIYLLLLTTLVFSATSYHGDSVMSPGVFSTAPVILSGQSKATGNSYTTTSVMQYQTASCPPGLTVNGYSTYNSAQRSITTTYLGSEIVGTTIGVWNDIDSDCIGYQYQVLTCPTGFTGSLTQQRKIGISTGGYINSDWITTVNNCIQDAAINIIVGYFAQSFLWYERFWGYSESNINGAYGINLYYPGSLATPVYIQGVRITDIFWNGSGDLSVWPNSLYIFGISGGLKYNFSCSDVAVNGVQATSPSFNGWTTNYGNFAALFGTVSVAGANIKIKTQSCTITSTFT